MSKNNKPNLDFIKLLARIIVSMLVLAAGLYVILSNTIPAVINDDSDSTRSPFLWDSTNTAIGTANTRGQE